MRIATWNMQGGRNTQYLTQVAMQTRANILCLQECGRLERFMYGLVSNGLYFTGNLRVGRSLMEVVYWYNHRWPQGGVAVLSNVGISAHGVFFTVPAPWNPPKPRSMPWITVRNGAADLTVLSIHSPPVWFGTLPQVCGWNNTQIAAVDGLHLGRWAMLGDFNADPTAGGFIPSPHGHLVRGPRATQQGGGLLDYAVTTGALNYRVSTPLAGPSDHYPQVFEAP